MDKKTVESWYFSHPLTKHNLSILKDNPMFRNEKEKDKSIAMFAVDNKFISRQEMYKLFGKIYREEVAE